MPKRKTMAARGKKIRNYPPYNDMVVTAINELKQQTGSSFKDISQYLPEKYNLPEGYEIQVKKALGRQLKKKAIIKILNFYKIKDVERMTPQPEKSLPMKDTPPMEVKPPSEVKPLEVKPKQIAQILPKKNASVKVKRLAPRKEKTGEIDRDKSFSGYKKTGSGRVKKHSKKATVKKVAAKK